MGIKSGNGREPNAGSVWLLLDGDQNPLLFYHAVAIQGLFDLSSLDYGGKVPFL